MTEGSELSALTAAIAAVGADAVRRGLVLASGGNLSARSPGRDAFVVTARGTWLNSLGDAADFVVVGLDGSWDPTGSVPSSEWKLHWRTYLARPDAGAIIHLHPQMAVLLDALGHPIRLLTRDHALYVRRVARVPFFDNETDELADSAAQAARESDAIVLAFHGCSSIGATVRDAYRVALNLEEAAHATFRMLQLGDTATAFPPDALEALLRSG
jgi:L-fuculose-phosphate aldolase